MHTSIYNEKVGNRRYGTIIQQDKVPEETCIHGSGGTTAPGTAVGVALPCIAGEELAVFAQ
jgi:hypothetical protein